VSTTEQVVTAIVGHHAELQETLSRRVDAVVSAARAGAAVEGPVAELRSLLVHDIVPHARAEEDALYAAATAPTLAPLVTGMVFEHETLLGLVDELAQASSPVDAAAVAAAIRAVFVGHVRRENEVLLPVLAADAQVDLPAILASMHDRLASYPPADGAT
jgi:hypothetical protein